MATSTSGSFDTSHRVSGNYDTYGHFAWEISSTGDGYTDIYWQFTGRTASQWQYVHVYSASVTVNGTVYSSWSGDMYNGTLMLEGTTRIPHTGEKYFEVTAGLAMYASGSWYDGGGSWYLPAVSSPVHLYGSVNGARKEIKHLYGSVNGSRKKIKKLYASVNGARKLIFRDDS